MNSPKLQFSVRSLAVAIALVACAAASFAQAPEWTIVVTSCIPFLSGFFFWVRDQTMIETRIKTFPLLCLAVIPIYISSMGPVLAFDERYAWDEFYTPLYWMAHNSIFETPLKEYARIWGLGA